MHLILTPIVLTGLILKIYNNSKIHLLLEKIQNTYNDNSLGITTNEQAAKKDRIVIKDKRLPR
jgi:hypothetical protein